MNISSLKIGILGSGNVATHLSKALYQHKYFITQVFSRNIDHAKTLANKINAKAINSLDDFYADNDILIFALPDDVLQIVLPKLQISNQVLIHTAGSVSIDVFELYSSNFGVLYPLQTFSKKKQIDLKTVPLFIEGNNSKTLKMIKNIAEVISNTVIDSDHKQRQSLHIAAVFACNFTNHFYSIANKLLKDKDIEFKYLLPLIEETANKVKFEIPTKAQTGPAIRNDKNTMQKHLKFLNDYPEWKDIYQMISKSIKKGGD